MQNSDLMRTLLAGLLCVFSVLGAPTRAQAADSLVFEDIFRGVYAARGIDALRSTADGQHYTLLERPGGRTQIVLYNYRDGQSVDTLFSDRGYPELEGKSIFTYILSPDERKILLGTDRRDVFRRSYTALYFLYDTASGTLEPVSDQRIQQPTFSPDGSKIAYAKDNDLYYKDLSDGFTRRVTHDGHPGRIINGTADWVYEEEFAIVRLFDWSPSSDRLAYVRFDETEVPLYGMDLYGNSLYPQRQTFKYPKAGERNSLVSLWIYDLPSDTTQQVEVPHTGEFYLPRLRWIAPQGKAPEQLVFSVMPRLQNSLHVYRCSPEGTDLETVYQDHSDTYLNLDDSAVFLEDGSVIFVSERDGYAHLYRKDRKGHLQALTQGPWQVTAFYGVDPKTSTAYFQSTSQGPENRDICAVNLRNGRIRRLSSGIGTHSASFSQGFAYYIDAFSNTTTPPLFTLNDPRDGSVIKVLEDNADLKARIDSLHLPEKRFGYLETEDSLRLALWTMLPADFDSTRSYPLLMYVYGGPGSQEVLNTWFTSQDLWFAYLTQKGYAIACVDGRGTGGRGADFEKTIYKRMGEVELHDQIKAAQALARLPYIDKARIGIFGWSFGGYMACLAATRGGDIWRAAVAVAPVTSWRFYDTIYTERYLSTPQENPQGYDLNSPLTYADDLSSRLLLVHGTADDNVHFQNSMQFSGLLVSAGKPFEQMVYADKNHSIYGGATRLHLFSKITNFLLTNL